MKRSLLLVVVWLLSTPLQLATAAPPAARPNILLICVDDLKPLLGCYGAPLVQSPNIDRLAARGVLFERAYCNQAVCSPSRNALLTGLRPQTLGIYDLSTNFRAAAPKAVTLPQHFKQHGYHTASLGKIFHVGHDNHDDAESWSIERFQPRGKAANVGSDREPRGKKRKGKKARGNERGAAFSRDDVSDSTYADGQVADEAIERLNSAKGQPDAPFFLAVGFVKPHLPFVAPRKYWDLYQPSAFELAARREPPAGAPEYAGHNSGELRRYQGMPANGPLSEDLQRTLIHGYHAATSYTDAQVGRVLAALEQNGQADQTIIVLWGDHGWHLGDHGMWCKHSNYEQAARIPLIIVAPGVSPQASRAKALVESVDLYPTLCDLAGLPAPAKVDGASLASIVRDPQSEGKSHVTHVYPRGERLGRAIRSAQFRMVEWKVPGAARDTAAIELYDYQADPLETKNIASEQPAVVAQLRSILDKQPEAKPQLTASGAR